MKKLLMSSVMLWMAIALFSCKGDTGAPGPAGADGNANVSITPIMVAPGDWNTDGNSGEEWDVSAGVSADPSDVVIVYYSTDGNTFYETPGGVWGGDELSFNFATGYAVTLTYVNNSSTAPQGTLYVNTAVIPASEILVLKQQKVDLKDYNEVKAFARLNSKSSL